MSDFVVTPEFAEEMSKEAHQVYLDNWETKTQFAENDCKWNADIQHRNHMAMEELASTVNTLALGLMEALQRIEQLEAQVQTQ